MESADRSALHVDFDFELSFPISLASFSNVTHAMSFLVVSLMFSMCCTVSQFA